MYSHGLYSTSAQQNDDDDESDAGDDAADDAFAIVPDGLTKESTQRANEVQTDFQPLLLT
jgi:hypothetical protein